MAKRVVLIFAVLISFACLTTSCHKVKVYKQEKAIAKVMTRPDVADAYKLHMAVTDGQHIIWMFDYNMTLDSRNKVRVHHISRYLAENCDSISKIDKDGFGKRCTSILALMKEYEARRGLEFAAELKDVDRSQITQTNAMELAIRKDLVAMYGDMINKIGPVTATFKNAEGSKEEPEAYAYATVVSVVFLQEYVRDLFLYEFKYAKDFKRLASLPSPDVDVPETEFRTVYKMRYKTRKPLYDKLEYAEVQVADYLRLREWEEFQKTLPLMQELMDDIQPDLKTAIKVSKMIRNDPDWQDKQGEIEAGIKSAERIVVRINKFFADQDLQSFTHFPHPRDMT